MMDRMRDKFDTFRDFEYKVSKMILGDKGTVLRIQSILHKIRIRPSEFKPDPDPACYKQDV